MALGHVHDDHVRMQLRVLGARQLMLERRSDEIAGALAMAHAGDLLAADGVTLHQRDRVAHRLVVGFDDRLVAGNQRLQGDALGRGEREVPPVALGCLARFEGRWNAPTVGQAAFEQRSKMDRANFPV